MTSMVKIGKTTASVPGGGTSYAPNPQTLVPDPAAPHVTWYLDETGATPGPGYGNNYYSMYVFIGPTPPASPFVGQLWWDSTNIGLFIWYDDGNSQQWVSAVAGVGAGADSALGPGTVTAVNTVGPGITGGPITTTGNLVVQWNAGQVFMLGNSLALSAGTLNTTLGDAPSDGHAYGRLNVAWMQVLPMTGGTLTGNFDGPVLASGSGTARALTQRFADPVNVMDFGAIADGSSHPLSSITSYGGVTTAGWTLAQWQAKFPFATALTNEIDQCALLQAVTVGASSGRAVFAPGGRYQCNFAPSGVAVAGAFTFTGGGPGITRLEVTNAGATALPIIVAVPAVVRLVGFSVYSTLLTTLGGNGIVLTGSTDTSGRPDIYFDHITVGNETVPITSAGALGIGIHVVNVSLTWLSNCRFTGSQAPAIVGANVVAGVGMRSEGNGASPPASFYTFGPNMVNCGFESLHQAVVIGDGISTAFTQGAKFSQCTWDFCNYSILWRSNASGAGNDYLSVDNCDIAPRITGIWTDTVATHQIHNCYFLCHANQIGVQIDNTGGSAIHGLISGNDFCGFGQSGATGLIINGEHVQASLLVEGNEFWDFFGTTHPLQIGAGTSGMVIANNMFRDNVNLPLDNGTSTHWYNNSTANSSAGYYSDLWLTGIPAAGSSSGAGNAYIGAGTSLFFGDPGSGISMDASGLTIGSAEFNSPYGNWSGHNWGKQLQITSSIAGDNDPALAITDSNGVNIWGLANVTGILRFALMPPYSDSTAVPNVIASMNSAGVTLSGTTTVAGLSASGPVSGAGFTAWAASPPAIGGVAPAAGSFTTLSASSTISGAGFSAWLASPPAIGGTAPAAGSFSTLGATTGAQWSASNFGSSLTVQSPGHNPAIGIADAGGTNWVALANNGGSGGSVFVSSMPALGNTSTAPVHMFYFGMTAGAIDFLQTLPGTGGATIGTGGQSTNVNLNLTPKGAGTVALPAAAGMTLGTAGTGPTVRGGAGAASGTQPSGSIWMRTDGTAGNRIYVSQGAGTWVAIASV